MSFLAKVSALRNRRGPFAIAIFLALVLLVGGSSRGDAQSQIFVRLIAIGFITYEAWRIRSEELAKVRGPLMFLAALAALMLLQLVPLPPSVWNAMPGHAKFADIATIAGFEPVWRPMALLPDRTINSLMALLPPLAAILIMATLPRRAYPVTLTVLLVLVLVSAVWGLAQITTGSSIFYLYRITNEGAAVGLFANRNHQGMFLALGLVMLFAYAARPSERTKGSRNRPWLALGAGIFLLLLILVAGSRSALIVGVIGVVASALLFRVPGRFDLSALRRASWQLKAAAASVLAIFAVSILIILPRAQAFDRLLSEDISDEIRYRLFMPMLDLGWSYFPFGVGFGGFVDSFKQVERLEDLQFSYLNHAHNDVLELFIDGGLPALLLLGAFAIWFALRAVGTVRAQGQSVLGKLGAIMIVMLGIGSLADYPLRTPLLSVVFAICCCWLAQSAASARQSARSE